MSNTHACRAVLRYPGSKWRIAKQLCDMIPEHKSYVEPYFGSGAVFFTKQASRIETINDLDLDVVNLFSCLQKDPEKLAAMVYTTPYSRFLYEQQFTTPLCANPYEKALSFLIKCWMGYGYRTNNHKNGWKNDIQGREKAYAVLNWNRLPDWVLSAAERLKNAQIECRPAIDLIERFNYENVFMYIDPPYLLNTRYSKQYRHEMEEKDHAKLLDVLVTSKAQIMISGYASELYDRKLSNWERIELKAQVESGRVVTEVVWTNYSVSKSSYVNNS